MVWTQTRNCCRKWKSDNSVEYANPLWQRNKSQQTRYNIIRDHTNQRCWIIDMAVPSDRNTWVKVVEKLSKYKDLEIEIARMWKMETETIPVVIGALGSLRRDWKNTLTKFQAQPSSAGSKKLLFWEQLTSSERFYLRTMVWPQCFRD